MDWLTNFLGTLFGIGQMQETLLGVTGTETVAGELSEIYGDEGILGAAIEQQEQAGQIGAGAATQVGTPPPGAGPQPSTYLTGFLGDIQSGEMDLTRPSITKPKKTSTEFVENIQDQLAQQTAGVTQDIARTGKFSGIKDVLGATDQAMITAQEKGAAMDQAYQKQLTDIEKFEAGQLSDIEKFEFGQESAVTQALAGQDFAGQQDWYDLAGDLATQSAIGGRELEGSVLGGIIDLQGQQAAATGDLITGVLDSLLELIPNNPFADSDEKLKKNIKKVGETEDGIPIKEFEYKDSKNAPEGPGVYRGVVAQDLIGTEHEGAVVKMDKNTLGVNYDELAVQLEKISGEGEEKKEYNKNGKDRDMMAAGEADVTPGKFSHKKNPIDIVQKRPNGQDEKIGEMTGGEGIMPPNDINELEALLAEGDKNAVFNKLGQLFSEWDQKTKEHEEKKMTKAMGGAKMHYMPKSRINYR